MDDKTKLLALLGDICPDVDFAAEELASAALADKKRAGDSITLVIPEAIGVCVQKTVPVTDMTHIIRAGLEA